jgi:murein DD-endopeptidase MepM/ murein hydrolase activator NlpD
MRRSALLAVFVLLAALGATPARAADWVFLKDGRVGTAGAEAEGAVAVTFPGGGSAKVAPASIRRKASEEVVAREVDAAVVDLAARRNLDARGKQLAALKAAAVPRLVHHLKSPRRRRRLVALCALHHCWSDRARKPLTELLADRDAEIRELSAGALAKRLKPAEARKLLSPLVEDEESRVASSVLGLLEPLAPDLERAAKCLRRGALHEALARHLPRYQSTKLNAATLPLLSSFEKKVRRSAAAALIHQGAGSPAVRRKLAALLSDADGAMRELAAEFFTRYGAAGDSPALKKALAAERDLHARAALSAAVAAIERRGGKPPEGAAKPEDFEPVWRYDGGIPPPGFQAGRERRLTDQARRLAIPLPPDISDFEGESRAPAAKELVPPVRDYFDGARSSYGSYVGKHVKAFANSVHVGDDVAWFCDERTVVAIGDGVVRRAGCSHTWGYIVIVEHSAADGSKFCSLYAHLGPFVHVKPGDVVKKGQKIGTVGRSRTWENGGYWAHLHFGVHRGAYLQEYAVGSEVPFELHGRNVKGKVTRCDPKVAWITVAVGGRTLRFGLRRRALWICGYVSPAIYKAGKHGWCDPQRFIRQRMRKKRE